MVGLVPKILLDLIDSTAGVEGVRRVKDLAGVARDKAYRLGEVYEDAEWRRLLESAYRVLDLSPEEAEIAYADVFFKDAQKRWPMWFEMSKTAREFIERQPAIHNNFATAVQDPEARKNINDKFSIDRLENELVTHSRSENKLCGLYKALARWILDHYGDTATIEETRCLKQGDPECEIHIRWS